MADYFSEYTSFVGGKGLPSPADTPYATPGFLKTRRSSRADTMGSRSRETSTSPPPLPPDTVEYTDKTRDGRYSALDPRRFTPTLHASFVSEILSLRRELESKNHLVEHLETDLATTKTVNEGLTHQLTAATKAARLANQQVQQIEAATLEALDAMASERDAAVNATQEWKAKLDTAQNHTRLQEEDAQRTQSIWEREKDSWDSERRQLERRMHVTESRLRAFVEDMAVQQAAHELQAGFLDDTGEVNNFNDSGVGLESDTGSMSPRKKKQHKRNASSISYKSCNGFRASAVRSTDTPEPWMMAKGNSLADELGIDEEDDDYDEDAFEHGDEEPESPQRRRRNVDSRQEGSVVGESPRKAKRISMLMERFEKQSSHRRYHSASSALRPVLPPQPEDVGMGAPRSTYVDTGCQPSPPPSPPTVKITPASSKADTVPIEDHDEAASQHATPVAARLPASPISPPETSVVDRADWSEHERTPLPQAAYADVATQTDDAETVSLPVEPNKRDSLQIPIIVPSIAIHPPSSRPSSPRPYVLPPGTKNASTQASFPGNSKDAEAQTEEIRVDKRQVRLPAHLLPSYLDTKGDLPPPSRQVNAAVRPTRREAPRIHIPSMPLTSLPSVKALSSPPLQSPANPASPIYPRRGSNKSLSSMPLKAIPLPKPVLAPPASLNEFASNKSQGPLNRSSQFGVGQGNSTSRQLAAMDIDSDYSDFEDTEMGDVATSMPRKGKAPMSAYGMRGMPDFPTSLFSSIPSSPVFRPGTGDSYDAAPAPSIASSKTGSNRGSSSRRPPPPKLNSYSKGRSPSFGSVASSNLSTQSAIPPYPVPMRSSSRVAPPVYSSGQGSPTPDTYIPRGHRNVRGAHQKLAVHQRQGSLRKVQSASLIRGGPRSGRTSPQKMSPQKKGRRRLPSPNLTPVQSMAFESPQPTKFPIPELPTPLQNTLTFDWGNRTSTSSKPPNTAASSVPPTDETQLIDAIASTMVGEWMWKYIRKRKSFGGDAADDFAAQAGEDRGIAASTHGTRHKRWVWLSPYERTIMWDSKQPTSGQALLGKKGRKLQIQAVLDVQDDTPLGRKPELVSAFSRSILILTPSRALKFTATDAKRHALWMSALNFLAEADASQTQLLPLPQMPAIPQQQVPTSPSVGRTSIRDSVNLSKSKYPSLLRSVSAQQPPPQQQHQQQQNHQHQKSQYHRGQHSPPPLPDHGADFPAIPRLYSSTARHQRKRSNTSPRLTTPFATNFRSFSSSAVPSSSQSTNPSTRLTAHSAPSSKPSVESSRPSEVDAVGIGTVRMEAFVDPGLRNGVLYVPSFPSGGGSANVSVSGIGLGNGNMSGKSGSGNGSPRGMGRRRQGSAVSSFTGDGRRVGYVFDDDGRDPFRGF